MNLNILHNNTQKFISDNITTDISKILFKGTSFPNVTTQEIVSQIEAKKRSQHKLPIWFTTENIYYPNKLNIEQTSSEITAKYKSELIEGNSIIDLTGGFGIDCYYFSKRFKSVTHCEINQELSKIVTHNYQHLKTTNIMTVANDGIEYLQKNKSAYDWIYIDPSRRNDIKGKVFLLDDCLPNVPENLSSLFKHSDNILIKVSPILDITSAINELSFVKEIRVVAVNNEVKELLFILEKGYLEGVKIKTVNILKSATQFFEFEFNSLNTVNFSLPKKYLYEPNAAILKSGGFTQVANQLNIGKLHQHSHLYSSDELIDFPGRKFEIKHHISFDKKQLKKLIHNKKANITTRNFPQTVAQIRKKTGIKDGGQQYLFFTTDLNNKHIILICEKV
ncbi:MAG: RsmD family RNA methyltransferase [Urechidicola sp.]|nr:RsmD family RNA methyltransferase [Urechidicola sp.]